MIRRIPVTALVAVTVAPLVVAVIALLWRPWAPILDMAMTEFRIRDVGGRHTPRIGLPGRIGEFPDQGSHPGPWSFYLVAPWYRLAGATAWGMQFGSVVINSAAFAGVTAIGYRLAGRRGALALATVAALAIRGYGLNVLTHPWNPYFPLALWLLLLVAAWAVLVGHHRLAVVVAVCATVAAQTHVPYLVSCVAVAVLVLVSLVLRWRRADGDDRRQVGLSTLAALGTTLFLWIPPIIDEIRQDPGNMTRLYRHFTGDPDEPVVGLVTAGRVFLRHLDLFGAGWETLVSSDGFVVRSGDLYGSGLTLSEVGGLAVLTGWIVSAAWIHRRGHALLPQLNVVLATALVAGAVAMSRIFGKVWFYLTLWAWATALLVLLSIGWTVWIALRDRRQSGSSTPDGVIVVVGLTATVLSIGAVWSQEVPEPQLSESLRAVVPATAEALEQGVGDAVGADGRYLVFWQDAAHIGAQGMGLLNELERRGFEVAAEELWRVPVTPHRTWAPGTYDAEVHLVTGPFIDDWRARPDHVEVATTDERTPEELARFGELRDQAAVRLAEIGRPELADQVDRNLFDLSLDPTLPRDIVDDLSEMLLIGVPVSVFIAPADSRS